MCLLVIARSPFGACICRPPIAGHPQPLLCGRCPPLLSTAAGSRVITAERGRTGTAAALLGLVAAGFADFPLIAFHFEKADVMPGEWIAVFYAVAMAVSGTGSLIFGRLFDRFGFQILSGLTMVTALFAPLVFLGGFWASLLGAAIWGIGMGVHESIIPAAVTPMVPIQRRASAFGLFTAGYGVSWFAGSALIGILDDLSVSSAIVFCVAAELAAVPIFIWVGRRYDMIVVATPKQRDESQTFSFELPYC